MVITPSPLPLRGAHPSPSPPHGVHPSPLWCSSPPFLPCGAHSSPPMVFKPPPLLPYGAHPPPSPWCSNPPFPPHDAHPPLLPYGAHSSPPHGAHLPPPLPYGAHPSPSMVLIPPHPSPLWCSSLSPPPPPKMVLIPPMVLPHGCSPWRSTALRHRPPAWGWWFLGGGVGQGEEPGQSLAVQLVGKGREKSVWLHLGAALRMGTHMSIAS